MTTAFSIICRDGVVLGTDMKVTAGDMKWAETKLLTQGRLGNRALIVAGAGSLRHVKDAVDWLEIMNLKAALGEAPTFNDFISKVLEVRLPDFVQDYHSKYGERPDLELLIAATDRGGQPKLVRTYEDANYDYLDDYAAIGSGSIFGEILLRRLYYPEITTTLAVRLVGYLVWEIQTVDNNSGEGMQIVSIDRRGRAKMVDQDEIEAYKFLPDLVSPSYDMLRSRVESVDLASIMKQIQRLQAEVERAKGQEVGRGQAN